MPKKTTSSDLLDAAIDQTVRETLAKLKQHRTLPYDGIMGSLYESWPQYHHNEFEHAREWILKKISHTDALHFIKNYDKMLEPAYNGLPTIPIGYQNAIGTLYDYFTAMQLGEVEGLRKVAGDDAVIGLRARRGHKERRAARVKQEIQRIGKQYWAANPKAIVKDILNCEEFKTYMNGEKVYAERTYQNWLREIDPRPPSAKRGPRSRKH